MNNIVKVNVAMAILVLDEGTPIGTADGQFWGMYRDMRALYHTLC